MWPNQNLSYFHIIDISHGPYHMFWARGCLKKIFGCLSSIMICYVNLLNLFATTTIRHKPELTLMGEILIQSPVSKYRRSKVDRLFISFAITGVPRSDP